MTLKVGRLGKCNRPASATGNVSALEKRNATASNVTVSSELPSLQLLFRWLVRSQFAFASLLTPSFFFFLPSLFYHLLRSSNLKQRAETKSDVIFTTCLYSF